MRGSRKWKCLVVIDCIRPFILVRSLLRSLAYIHTKFHLFILIIRLSGSHLTVLVILKAYFYCLVRSSLYSILNTSTCSWVSTPHVTVFAESSHGVALIIDLFTFNHWRPSEESDHFRFSDSVISLSSMLAFFNHVKVFRFTSWN